MPHAGVIIASAQKGRRWAAPVQGPGPPQGTTVVSARVTRLTAGTGPILVSSGFPTWPGIQPTSATGNVRVFVEGIEQRLYVEELDGRHADGSVRSVLVQFTASVTAGTPLAAEVWFGQPRETTDIAKTAINAQPTMPQTHPSTGQASNSGTHQLHLYGYPGAVLTATDPAYLIGCDVVLPRRTRARHIALGGDYANWVTQFEAGADFRWVGDWDQSSHDAPGNLMSEYVYGRYYYDRAEAYYAHFIGSADPKWLMQAASYQYGWRELYARASNYHYDPYHSFVEGLLCHYWFTGDPEARNAIIQQSQWWINDPVWDVGLGSRHSGVQDPRNSAYALKGFMACYRLGLTTLTSTNGYGSATLLPRLHTDGDKMRGIGTYDNSDNRYPSHPQQAFPMYQVNDALGQIGMWAQGLDAACPMVLTNFMQGGLVPDVLLKYKRWVDPSATWVDTVLKGAVDWQWAHQWRPNIGYPAEPSFNYLTGACIGEGDASFTPALNYLFASNYAYVGRTFSDTSYFANAETIAAGSNIDDITYDRGCPSCGKVFNQQYVLSFPMAYWIYGA